MAEMVKLGKGDDTIIEDNVGGNMVKIAVGFVCLSMNSNVMSFILASALIPFVYGSSFVL